MVELSGQTELDAADRRYPILGAMAALNTQTEYQIEIFFGTTY